MADKRPDPDQLLKVVSKELRQDGRGRLKIFLGACAGVGKTYAMLVAARQEIDKGVDVAIGVVETHDRTDVERLLEDIPRLPLRPVNLHGRIIRDFDIDAALTAGRALVLVDELAHSNPAGSRHAKRWGDIEELVAAGIDVYTTVNVQHLESLADLASGIIGIRVRETVPDRVFDDATEVVLVDLPPDDLLARLDAGNVFVPVSVEHARQNFFRKGNIVALRELALRRVADRVNADVTTYRRSQSIDTVWSTRERVMVCVSAAQSQERLITEGIRIAQRLSAECHVVHVRAPTESDDERECVHSLARLAGAHGTEFVSVVGNDVVETLLECVRTNNVTKLVLGHGTRRWDRPWRRQFSEQITRANPELGILSIPVTPTPRPAGSRRPSTGPFLSARGLLITTAACAVTTLVATGLFRYFAAPNLLAFFTLTVVVVSLRFGRVAAIWAALLSVASFDFFFVPPYLSFAMSDTQYLFTFLLILVIAIVASEVGTRLGADARNARAGERREATVARVARDLSGALEIEQIVEICAQTIVPLFEAKVAVILPDSHDQLRVVGQAGFEDLSVAQWAYDHVQRAGRGTDTLSAADALYLPLKAPILCRGVLAIQPREWSVLEEPDEKRLLEACCSSIALALERIHFAEIAQETLLRMEGERLRNSLLSAVSHDLRTPLTAIRGLAETLERGNDLPSDERTDVASAIRNQADSLQRVVTNLLDLARMQSAGIRLNKEWHALGEIVGSALSRLGPVLSGHPIRTDVPSDLPLLEVDASLIERVFVNLLDNALKYTPAGTPILIAAQPAGDSLYCFVEDSGPGLPSGDPEQFFEAFRRGQKESSISGVGLGLALCRSIIAAHGGTIHAEASSPSGARFEIRLPLGSSPPVAEEAS